MQAKSKEIQDFKDLNQKSGSDPARDEEIEQYHDQIRQWSDAYDEKQAELQEMTDQFMLVSSQLEKS